MVLSPLVRATKIMQGVREDLLAHAGECGDRVLGVALSPTDFDQLQLVELWELPVLSWSKLDPGRYRLLCEADGELVPQFGTVDEMVEYWACSLDPPSEAEAEPYLLELVRSWGPGTSRRSPTSS